MISYASRLSDTSMILLRFTVFICLVLTIFFNNSLSANESTSSRLGTQDSDLQALAQDKQWLDLLHYHQIGLFSRFESQADDPAFFFSPTGKTDPEAELKATLHALANSDHAADSAICRFPARLHWLQSKGHLNAVSTAGCHTFNEWFTKIDGESLTLAFPAAYLNSPSSMYGHTFIRINRKHGKNPLLDYSVNYAANADPDDNELLFSFKGLTGGYPGVFSVLPYYQKVTEYSHLEARDVWEYDLALSTEEVAQFIRHAWEIQNTHFDYYFFDENCSYHLLTLLDAASPRLNLSDQFMLSAIPADTVREIRQAGLIEQAIFRPSTMSLLSNMLKQSSDEIQRKAKALVETKAQIAPDRLTEALDPVEAAKLLELAYQYSRYLSIRKKQDQKLQAKKAMSILSARSKIEVEQVFTEHPTPTYRDDEGHHSKRLETSFGRIKDQHFSQLGLRMAYHDRLDNLPGYLSGAQLEMFHLKLRHTKADNSNNRTTLEALTLIDIASYSPRNDFVSPLSWEVSTGLKRPSSYDDELVAFLSAGWGQTYLLGSQQFYGLGFFDFHLDDDIRKGHHLSAGPKIGWLSQHETWSINLEIRQLFDLSGTKNKLRELELGLSKTLARHWQVRLVGQYLDLPRDRYRDDSNKTFQFSVMHYF